VVKIAVPDGVGVVVVDAPVVVTLVVGSAVAMVDSTVIVTHAHTQTIVFTTMYRQPAIAEKNPKPRKFCPTVFTTSVFTTFT